jgi:hypothetical protein
LGNYRRMQLLRVGLNICLKMRLSLANSGVMDYDTREEDDDDGFL